MHGGGGAADNLYAVTGGLTVDTQSMTHLWGVEQFTHTNRAGKQQRLIAASDRDHGLYIYRYTGR